MDGVLMLLAVLVFQVMGIWQELGNQHSAVVSQTQLHFSFSTHIPIGFSDSLFCDTAYSRIRVFVNVNS